MKNRYLRALEVVYDPYEQTEYKPPKWTRKKIK